MPGNLRDLQRLALFIIAWWSDVDRLAFETRCATVRS
jgi:hypothetical protein